MILLSSPLPPNEALASLLRRQILPTSLDTAGLQQLSRDVQLDSFYSAQTLLEDLLAGYKDRLEQLIAPSQVKRPDRVTADNPEGLTNVGLSENYARSEIQDLLAELGYAPNPGEEGTLKDLSSDRRVNLVFKTNVQMYQNEGWWLQGQKAAILDEFPAQELFRAESRKVHRDWMLRFRLAGEASGSAMGDGWTITPDGRMIALKNHPIWTLLGSPKLFKDGLGNPWPPYAYDSGMNLRDIARAVAIKLGIMQTDQVVQPMSLNDLREAA